MKRKYYPSLKAWRSAQQLTQIQAAERLGIAQAHYSKLERRAVRTLGARARDIADQTGVPLAVLVGADRP